MDNNLIKKKEIPICTEEGKRQIKTTFTRDR